MLLLLCHLRHSFVFLAYPCVFSLLVNVPISFFRIIIILALSGLQIEDHFHTCVVKSKTQISDARTSTYPNLLVFNKLFVVRPESLTIFITGAFSCVLRSFVRFISTDRKFSTLIRIVTVKGSPQPPTLPQHRVTKTMIHITMSGSASVKMTIRHTCIVSFVVLSVVLLNFSWTVIFERKGRSTLRSVGNLSSSVTE